MQRLIARDIRHGDVGVSNRKLSNGAGVGLKNYFGLPRQSKRNLGHKLNRYKYERIS